MRCFCINGWTYKVWSMFGLSVHHPSNWTIDVVVVVVIIILPSSSSSCWSSSVFPRPKMLQNMLSHIRERCGLENIDNVTAQMLIYARTNAILIINKTETILTLMSICLQCLGCVSVCLCVLTRGHKYPPIYKLHFLYLIFVFFCSVQFLLKITHRDTYIQPLFMIFERFEENMSRGAEENHKKCIIY